MLRKNSNLLKEKCLIHKTVRYLMFNVKCMSDILEIWVVFNPLEYFP
jgi:hypothetical protein